MQNTLLQELILEDYWNCTAICYDNGERKLYVTYSDLLQSSSEFAGYLRKCVGVNKVCCFGGRANFSLAHVTLK